ncbi:MULTISPECIES: FAD-dependent oxidoreductase [Actinomycetes]|uniref:NAD(P)/FAD-dependent oxidoreductase n=2 Tax=Actinomycetes TaxID=1760 RepID=A0ABP6LUD3_9MICC
MNEQQIVVIGAGPAGLAAAVAAAEHGGHVLLVDAGPRTGGQYWRHADPENDATPGRWHHGWSRFQRLVSAAQRQIRTGRLEHLPGHQVLALQPGEPLTLTLQKVPELQPAGASANLRQLRAQQVVLAPGTFDRQLPVPGWTLPGVMAAGGIQAFIKTHGQAPGQRAVVAGTGPFLLAAAASLLHAGADVAAVVESSDLTGWLPDLGTRSAGGTAGLLVPSKAAEGAEYLTVLARHRVPYLRRAVVTAIHGDTRAEAVTVARLQDGRPHSGSERHVEGIDMVGLSWGFTPQAELLVQSGAATRIDADGSLVGIVDAEQRSNVPGLALAGEITGVAGAVAAVLEGRIAGISAVHHLEGCSRPASGVARAALVRDRVQLANHRRFAAAMHRAHRLPAGWTDWLEEETLICRCEEVPFAKVRDAADQLRTDEPRGLKGVTRVGMGWCQGRMCGAAAQCLSSSRTDTGGPEADEHGHRAARSAAHRPSSAPMRLRDIAALPPTPDDSQGQEPRRLQ